LSFMVNRRVRGEAEEETELAAQHYYTSIDLHTRVDWTSALFVYRVI